MGKASYRSVITVAFFALLTLSLLDLGLRHLVPIVHRREVQEGMADFERVDPQILVLGSSHARTFHVLGQELARRTGGQKNLVAIPLENGKISPYEWVLDHRIAPVLDESESKRRSLRRFVILTEWWDTCRSPDYIDWNLPSRAWTWRDYLSDLIVNGVNSFNRNYVQNRWRRLFWNSAIVQDRGRGALFGVAKSRLMGQAMGRSSGAEREIFHSWQKMIEAGADCVGNPYEMAALDHLLDFASQRGLDATIVLFPRKPGTLTERAKETTLRLFHDQVVAVARPRGVRVVDLTSSTPLTDDDFMEDFDHVNPEGNAKFAKWALDGPLSFLLTDPPPPVAKAQR